MVSERYGIVPFRVTTASRCYVNLSYVLGDEETETFVSLYHLYSLITGDILASICYVWIVYVTDCDLIYEDLGGENVHKYRFSKCAPMNLIGKQQDNSTRHL
jgi:hypothetical protein